MDKSNGCCSFRLIDEYGTFNYEGVEKFMKRVKPAISDERRYAFVSIIGAQSSGKSTLLNHLFGTNFKEMVALEGRSRTTCGVWLAKSPLIELCTFVMDLEGTDGNEREEDDKFDKWSALFALAVSHVVLLNLWANDIGRMHAANKPLLKIVFQVMRRIFGPRKTTLMFVIRDKTMTPLHLLQRDLMKDITKIWDSIPNPQPEAKVLSDFFNVEIVGLPHYEYQKQEFKTQVADLRRRFINSIAPGEIAGDRRDVVPASMLASSLKDIWKLIEDDKELDLPAHAVMVSTVRCEEIVKEKFGSFVAKEDSGQLLKKAEKSPLEPGCGKKLRSIVETCLLEYDKDAAYFLENVRFEKREQLKEKLLKHVQPVVQSMLEHVRNRIIAKFKKDFEKDLAGGKIFNVAARSCFRSCMNEFEKGRADVVVEQSNWDPSMEYDTQLQRDIRAHIDTVRKEKLLGLSKQHAENLGKALSEPVKTQLDIAGDNTWAEIRKLVSCRTESAKSSFSPALSGFNLGKEIKNEMLTKLDKYARDVVACLAKEGAGTVQLRMNDRFGSFYKCDFNQLSSVEDITTIEKKALSASLKVLSVMAAIRLDCKSDNIEKILFDTLMSTNESIVSDDPLAERPWKKVSETLITPAQCKSIWMQFNDDIKHIVKQATFVIELKMKAGENESEFEEIKLQNTLLKDEVKFEKAKNKGTGIAAAILTFLGELGSLFAAIIGLG
ncbi:hypothetical protein F0562_023892 [Nyssa sinensis]|uniref:GB1/RHD3-type G domain-containing protein n=1 Tax=Nyssa sinensis TaxID=561372 RepID=A0A5J5BKG3_9ASTE|nr:hypothetical protein F0562_023892 [Nyssa sinensis]